MHVIGGGTCVLKQSLAVHKEEAEELAIQESDATLVVLPMRLCIYVCICAYIYIYIYTHTYVCMSLQSASRDAVCCTILCPFEEDKVIMAITLNKLP